MSQPWNLEGGYLVSASIAVPVLLNVLIMLVAALAAGTLRDISPFEVTVASGTEERKLKVERSR